MNAPLEPIAADDAVAIGRLVAEFHYLIDQGQASECLALLAEDARLVFAPGSPNPGEIAGREAIEAFLTARQSAPVTTRHLLGQTRLAVLGPGRIGALTILALFKAPAPSDPLLPAAVADLDEVYIRTDEGWRLQVREVRPVDWTP